MEDKLGSTEAADADSLSRMREREITTAERVREAGSRLVKSRVHAAFRLTTGHGFVKTIHHCRAGRGQLNTADNNSGLEFCGGNPRAVPIT